MFNLLFLAMQFPISCILALVALTLAVAKVGRSGAVVCATLAILVTAAGALFEIWLCGWFLRPQPLALVVVFSPAIVAFGVLVFGQSRATE